MILKDLASGNNLMQYKIRKISGDASFREFYKIEKNSNSTILVKANKNKFQNLIDYFNNSTETSVAEQYARITHDKLSLKEYNKVKKKITQKKKELKEKQKQKELKEKEKKKKPTKKKIIQPQETHIDLFDGNTFENTIFDGKNIEQLALLEIFINQKKG